MFERRLLLQFEQLFPKDNRENLSYYIDGVKEYDLIKALTFFLEILNTKCDYKNGIHFILKYFSHENENICKEILFNAIQYEPSNSHLDNIVSLYYSGLINRVNAIDAIERYNPKLETSIISPYSILCLIEHCLNNTSNPREISDKDLEVNFFKAILTSNSLVIKKEDDLILKIKQKELSGNISLAYQLFVHQYATSEFINFYPSHLFKSQIVKSICFFNFFEENKDYEKLLPIFLKENNCKTWQEYIKRIIRLLAPDKLCSNIEIVAEDKDSIDFLDLFTKYKSKQNSGDDDFISLRENFLYKVKRDNFRVIFWLFVYEAVFKGLYFKFNKIDIREKIINDFVSKFKKKFSEEFLTYQILSNVFKDKCIHYTGEEISAMGIAGEPDYYLQDENNLFLFESKDFFVKATIKSSLDIDNLLHEFEKRLYKEGDKNGAVLQLMNFIDKYKNKQYSKHFNIENQEGLNIYPIIITHDRQYNVPVLNYLVNEWYYYELQNFNPTNFSNTRPITVIDIDTFIIWFDYFKKGQFDLAKLIDEYHNSHIIKAGQKFKDIQDFENTVLGTYTSFYHFLRYKDIPESNVFFEDFKSNLFK